MPHSRALFDTQEWARAIMAHIAIGVLLAEAGHPFAQAVLSHFVGRTPFFDGHNGGQAALYAPSPQVAPVALALPVEVRARDAGVCDHVAIDAERPRLPAQVESRTVAFVGSAPRPGELALHPRRYFQGTGTSSKRFMTVAPALLSMPST